MADEIDIRLGTVLQLRPKAAFGSRPRAWFRRNRARHERRGSQDCRSVHPRQTQCSQPPAPMRRQPGKANKDSSSPGAFFERRLKTPSKPPRPGTLMRLPDPSVMVTIQKRDCVGRADLRTGKRKNMVDRQTEYYRSDYGQYNARCTAPETLTDSNQQ